MTNPLSEKGSAIALSNPTSPIAYGTHSRSHPHPLQKRSHSPIPQVRLPTARTRVRTHIPHQKRSHFQIPQVRLPTARCAIAPTSITKHDNATHRCANALLNSKSTIAQELIETTSPASLRRTFALAGREPIIALTFLIKGTRWSGLILVESNTTILIKRLARFC
ncbi:hypothetical protein LAY57_24455 [Argonema antarcticum A004/B2]|nr:hypothetical protein [Argonema antarcticum]MCL1473790.1 hypothetical protein [Argonema antarcticum A004/B2]